MNVEDVEGFGLEDLQHFCGEREGIRRVVEERVRGDLDFVEVNVRVVGVHADGRGVGDEVHVVAAGGELLAKLGRDDTGAAVGGIAGNADAHGRGPLPHVPDGTVGDVIVSHSIDRNRGQACVKVDDGQSTEGQAAGDTRLDAGRGETVTRPATRRKSETEAGDYAEVANRTLRENPATSLLGFEAVSVTHGRAVLKLDVEERHRQVHGVVHGGILAALVDTAAAIAAYTTVPRGTALATIELKINYLEAVPGGRIEAIGKVLRAGRNFVVAECELIDARGKLAAKALMTFGAMGGHSIEKK